MNLNGMNFEPLRAMFKKIIILVLLIASQLFSSYASVRDLLQSNTPHSGNTHLTTKKDTLAISILFDEDLLSDSSENILHSTQLASSIILHLWSQNQGVLLFSNINYTHRPIPITSPIPLFLYFNSFLI